MSHVHVDPAGNDTTGDGSIGNPYLTYGKAYGVLGSPGGSGHIVTCHEGTYTEILYDGIAGWGDGDAWDNAITLEGAAGETIIMHPGAADSFFNFNTHSYQIFSNFAVNGDNLTFIAHINPPAHHIRYLGLDYHSSALSGLLIGNPFTEIISCIGHDLGGVYTDHGIYCAGGGDNILVEKNEFFNIPGAGVQIYSSEGPIDDCLVQRNYIHACGLATSPQGAGVYFGAGDNNQFLSNIIALCDYAMVMGNGYSLGTNCKIYGNTIYACIDVFAFVGGQFDVRGNICWPVSGTLFTGDVSQVTTTPNYVTDPLFVNAGANDFHLQAGTGAGGAPTLAELTTDYDGVSRGQPGGPFFGAFELVGGGVGPTPSAPASYPVSNVAYTWLNNPSPPTITPGDNPVEMVEFTSGSGDGLLRMTRQGNETLTEIVP